MALLQDTKGPPATAGTVAAPALAGGSLAGFLGGTVLLGCVMTAAELASEPTAKAGLDTGVATVPNAVTSFTFATGLDSWNDGYTWATYPGIAMVLLAGTGLGVLGVALTAALLGRRPSVGGAAITGAIYGALLHLILLSGIVDSLQDVNGVHTSAPEWSWWAGNIAFGLIVGVVGGGLLRRLSGSAEEADGSR